MSPIFCGNAGGIPASYVIAGYNDVGKVPDPAGGEVLLIGIEAFIPAQRRQPQAKVPSAWQEPPPPEQGGDYRRREDDPECRAGDHRWHPGELRMKLLISAHMIAMSRPSLPSV
jgi:hypothetical protein